MLHTCCPIQHIEQMWRHLIEQKTEYVRTEIEERTLFTVTSGTIRQPRLTVTFFNGFKMLPLYFYIVYPWLKVHYRVWSTMKIKWLGSAPANTTRVIKPTIILSIESNPIMANHKFCKPNLQLGCPTHTILPFDHWKIHYSIQDLNSWGFRVTPTIKGPMT